MIIFSLNLDTGCPANTFNCEDWTRRYRRENCVLLSQRCDGVQQCPNGKDEKDCNILTGSYIEEKDVSCIAVVHKIFNFFVPFSTDNEQTNKIGSTFANSTNVDCSYSR